MCTNPGFPRALAIRFTRATSTPVWRAIRDGAKEIDMVINIGALKGGGHQALQVEVGLGRLALLEAATDHGAGGHEQRAAVGFLHGREVVGPDAAGQRDGLLLVVTE